MTRHLTPKQKQMRDNWVADTRMFQRVAGVTVATREDLERDWDGFTARRRVFFAKNIAEHRIIQNAAVRAGRGRRS